MRILLQLRTPFVSSEVETRGHAQALLDFARSERMMALKVLAND
jgi:hypothetical protein